MRVLDLSNHDWPTFDAGCLKVAGVTRVILGCWDFAIAESMLLALRREGILVEDLYCFLYYRLPWENNDVLNARELARRHGGIKRIWLDCEAMFDGPAGLLDTEAEGTTVTHRQTITAGYAVDLGADFEVGIYTGAYWWPSKMGNSIAFNDLPLWLANYGSNDPDAPRDPTLWVDFGGWTDVAVHQYSSTIPVCGRGRDHNYWFLEEDDMELKERLARLERIVAGNHLTTEVWDGNVEDLKKLGFDNPIIGTTIGLEGEKALAYADMRGFSFALGVKLARDEAAEAKQLATASGGKLAPGTKFSVEVTE